MRSTNLYIRYVFIGSLLNIYSVLNRLDASVLFFSLKSAQYQGACLAWSLGHATLDLRVMSSSLLLGVRDFLNT